MYPEIYNPTHSHIKQRWNKQSHEDNFKCKFCGALVHTHPIISGVQNRNHCPYCLYSRHVDHAQAGDRLSACKAIMQPIGLTIKTSRNKYGKTSYGELMIIHQCTDCGKLSINRLAADDMLDRLLDIYHASGCMDEVNQRNLIVNGIYLMHQEDWKLVEGQLWGKCQI